ncbi:hypothetical protein Tco_0389738 [Tanacetum coccineum]
MRCGSGLSIGLCFICASRYGNNPNPNSLNDSPNISENVSQSPPLIDHHYCYGCEEPLDGFFCQQCTCKSCGNGAHYGYNCPPQLSIISNPEPCNNQTVDELPQTLPSFDPTCYSGDGSSFTYDSTPNFVDDSPNVFNPPSQPPTYSCEFCRNNAHYGYDCPPQVSFIYNPEPCYNQDFNFPQNFQGPHETFQCQPMNYYEPNLCYESNYSGFDQFEPPQHPVIHQPIQEKTCAELLAEERAANIDQSPPQEMSIQDMEDLKQHYLDEMKSLINDLQIKDYRNERIDIQYRRECEIRIDELKQNFNGMSIEIRKKEKELLQQEQAAYVSTSQRFNFIYDDDDDEESSIPLSDVISELPPCVAITPVLSTEEPDNSLSMGDEHLDTIPAMESDEVIKSSVENLVPIPSESEDFSNIESECDVPDCDNSQTEFFSTFSNPLFYDCTSSDDELSHEEVIHEISIKTYSNPLLDLDEEIISSEFNPIHNEGLDSTLKNDHFDTESYLLESLLNRDTLMASSPKIDSLLDEFVGEIITIPPRIIREHEEYISMMERLLYDNSSPWPLEAFQANSNTIIESLPSFHIPVEDSDSLREDINIFPGPDDSIPPGIERYDYDSEGDDNSTSLPEFESFHVDYPDSGDSTIDVVEDIPVDVPNILPTHPTLHMDFDFIPSHNDLGSMNVIT